MIVFQDDFSASYVQIGIITCKGQTPTVLVRFRDKNEQTRDVYFADVDWRNFKAMIANVNP